MDEDNFDLVIIGAGIIGACTAWFAGKRWPQWRIAIVDKSEVGSGATFHSASLDIPFGHTPVRYKFSKRSRLLFSELRKQLPALPIKDLNFYGIVQESNATNVLKNVTQDEAKISPEIIPVILNSHPFLKPPEHSTFISNMNATQATSNEVAIIIAKNFEVSPQCAIFRQTEILRVSFTSGKYQLESRDGKSFHSKRVVQATGPWMNEVLGKNLLSAQKVRIKKIVAFHLPKVPAPDDPVFYFFDDDAFLMPKHEDGYWLFSFRCDHWDVLPDSDKLSIDGADIEKAQGILKKYTPEFAPFCQEGRVFCDGYSQDGDPVIEELENYPGYIVAGAGAGSGYRLAPAIAEEVLNLLQGW